MSRVALLIAIALGAGACGPIAYVNEVTRRASTSVDAAKAAQADKYAPYYWTRANQYLHQARVAAARADFQGANRFGRLASEAGDKAVEESAVVQKDPSKGPIIIEQNNVAPAKGEAPIAPAKDGVAPAKDAVKRALALLCIFVVAGAACAGTEIRSKTGATSELIATARDHGAQRCAPVELAMAESNNDFAQHELDEGNYHEAKELAGVAERNAQLAIEKSPKDKCTAGEPVAGPGDTDGDGIINPKDSCPRVPEDFDNFQDEDGCPEDDNDADGINDKIDNCPMDPEDRDSFEDDDGCPDPDNDKDGLNDKIDQCPNDPEDKDNFEDDDGCPDLDNDKDGIPDVSDKCPLEPGAPPDGCPKKYNLVVVTDKKIEIKQTVYFDTNKASIKKVSFALLNEVAQALKDNPTIEVEVQGHTDSQGNDNFNMKLSQNRANSVRAYLMKQGVDSVRMTAKGYGENVMIADNRTAEGRSQNRRVEFIITKR